MGKGQFALFASGTIVVFIAGFFKATWKLLYAAGVCDFQALSNCFFPMQSVGFLLAALGVLAMVFYKTKKAVTTAAVAPPFFSGTMVFVVVMVLGVLSLDLGLCVEAARRKKYVVLPVLILSFLFVLGMGYLSSKDFVDPAMNWIAEGVNIVGQGLFLVGALLLRGKKKSHE